jgi:hypothetical protein
MAGQLLSWKTAIRYRAEGALMPNAIPRCSHCGYALINGHCPIPCKGKPLADDCVAVVQPVTLYWTPKAA